MPKKPRPDKKKRKPAEELPQLDPILPLPAGTGLPKLKQGDGKDQLHNDKPVIVELPYNAAFLLWEHAEARAAAEYPKYVTGPLSHIAEARLQTVRAFRSTFNNLGDPLTVWTEEEAQRIRSKAQRRAKKVADAEAQAKRDKRTADKASKSGSISEKAIETTATSPSDECAHSDTSRKKSKKTGEKYVLCNDCGAKWPATKPAEAPTSPSKGSRGARGPKAAPKTEKKPQKSKKRPKA